MRSLWPRLLVALLLAREATAQEYLVVGSFAGPASANKEAQRLRQALGVQVEQKVSQQDGVTRYRLLVKPAGGKGPVPSLLEKLASAGVKQPWRITLADTPEVENSMPAEKFAPVTEASPVFLLVGRFTGMEDAIARERKLENVFIGVTSRSAFEGDTVYYRVLLGPIDPRDLVEIKARLAEAGIKDASPVDVSDVDDPPLIKATIIEPLPASPTNIPVAPGKPRPADDWNAARLNKPKQE